MRISIVLFGVSILGLACDSDAPTDTSKVNCEMDRRIEVFVPNMLKTSSSGNTQVTLVSSEPSPPARGNNTWRLRITTQAGQPVSGAPITITSFMPDHGHGTSVRPTITAGEDGVYDVSPLYLFMGGVWRITVGQTTDAGPADDVVFHFCIQG